MWDHVVLSNFDGFGVVVKIVESLVHAMLDTPKGRGWVVVDEASNVGSSIPESQRESYCTLDKPWGQYLEAVRETVCMQSKPQCMYP